MITIGCDVGGTNSRLALVDEQTGQIIARRRHPSHVGDYFAGYAALVRDIRELQGTAGRAVPVGIAVAAQLDPTRRRALVAPNLRWSNAPLADDLQKALDVPVSLENDVRGAAWGELAHGALRGVRTAACVFWGSGIGGAVIADGQVVSGGRAIAGEVGHLVYDPGGLACACGKAGCFEAYAGGHALFSRMKKKRIPGASAVDLLSAAKKGNPAARALVSEAVDIGALLIANIVTLLDPERIVLGGGLGLALFAQVKKAAKGYVLKVRKGDIPLVQPELGDDAGLIGAGRFATFDKALRAR